MSLVSAAWLRDHIDDPDLRVLDVRWYLADPSQGAREYADGHIPGAVFLDLENDLSDMTKEGRGRHPLPDPYALAHTLSKRGIGDGHHVVAYDHGPSSIAARTWWLLRHIGMPVVSVLDGGVAAWQAGGGALTSDELEYPQATLTVRLRQGDTASMDDVASRPDTTVLLDARAPERFRGEVEPVDPVAGHIPGAVSLPHASLVDDRGPFLPPPDLRSQLTAAGIAEGVNSIASCGSGVTACHLILAAVTAGLPEPQLYPGSFSQWSVAGRPVETEPRRLSPTKWSRGSRE